MSLMTPEEKFEAASEAEIRILYHLIWVWFQYGSHEQNGDRILLYHQCTTAGEDACDLLDEYGLAFDNGRSAELTEAGIKLLKREDIE